MARSSQTKHNPRAMKKALKRTCLDAGMSRDEAVRISLSCLPTPRVSGTTRRNPGRMDGVQWKADSFICPEHIDGPDSICGLDEALGESGDGSFEEDEDSSVNERSHIISLLDIAKPAKPKGIKKEYEVVDNLRQVIFLDEELSEQWEDWEEIDKLTRDEREIKKPTLSYAAALQSKG
ncbi:hypothetical protein EV361DRAFT_928936 [Lentinula raphanica]|nr:hypothetical protein EV361DRAFT_928936 [Lentinula raphanica]